jgi:hypothetical protein
MRALFGVASLLVVLAIVVVVAKQQLQAVKALPSAAPTAPVTGEAGTGTAPSVREQAKNLQRQVQQDVQSALQQGAAARASDPEQ